MAKFFKFTGMFDLYYFLNYLKKHDIREETIRKEEINPVGITTGCNVVIGRNRLGLRRYDYSRS